MFLLHDTDQPVLISVAGFIEVSLNETSVDDAVDFEHELDNKLRPDCAYKGLYDHAGIKVNPC